MSPNPKPIAYLVRHPEVDSRYKGLFVSWSDVDVSEQGWKDAAETIQHLQKFGIEIVYSSPLKRALEFAELLSDDVRQTRGLLPWNRGVLTGLADVEAKGTLALFMKNPKVKIPMGESRNECEQRITDFYGPALKEAERHPTAFFTHHSNIDVLNGLIEGKHGEEPVNLVKTCGIVAVHLYGDDYRLEPIYRADTEAAASMS